MRTGAFPLCAFFCYKCILIDISVNYHPVKVSGLRCLLYRIVQLLVAWHIEHMPISSLFSLIPI